MYSSVPVVFYAEGYCAWRGVTIYRYCQEFLTKLDDLRKSVNR